MKRITVMILMLLAGLLGAIEPAAEALLLFEAKQYIAEEGDTLLYRLLSPQKIIEGKTYPLVLFLHGSGERGRDNARQLIWGAGTFIDAKNRQRYPAFVLAPQCPEDQRWVEVHWALDAHRMPEQPSRSMKLVMELLQEMQERYAVDASRIYVTGLSMGGYGTWDILSRLPQTFAAAVPICGGGDESRAETLKDIPLWVFHGALDTTVPPERSRNMVAAIREAGGKKIRYTEYPDVAHGSWKPAYADPKLLRWLFNQRKKR
ncbi:MAG: prolyl oligopeptidase family serine peptidase [Candidatus Neomarinimicrobiota bacterium]|jgi:predicted peptidase|nr:prolyl oligopeptidase family serine peptidase [Candidatus Neomarinimicrobiota bacterium]MDD3966152.1 prolyl oligopeptidase family serine peptidase [Candidatus Neomarinimicrobiota bacterium]MDX9780622.1 prolyl oligopeptidase family serine peptidase [bacterium]